jgi:hypothetical protein
VVRARSRRQARGEGPRAKGAGRDSRLNFDSLNKFPTARIFFWTGKVFGATRRIDFSSKKISFFEKVANAQRYICAIHCVMQLLFKKNSPQFASPHTLFRLLSYTASYFLA